MDIHFYLPLMADPSKFELNAQRLFVNGFEEAWAEKPMDFDGGRNDPFGK
jgi:hypothetical protein